MYNSEIKKINDADIPSIKKRRPPPTIVLCRQEEVRESDVDACGDEEKDDEHAAKHAIKGIVVVMAPHAVVDVEKLHVYRCEW